MDFDHLHLWIERASAWLLSCLSQFWGWKIPIQVGVWRGYSRLSWSFNGVVFAGVSYMEARGSFYCNTLSTISSFYGIFLLMEGLRFGWAIVLFGRAYHGTFLIVISLIYSVIHLQEVSGWNTQWLNVKVIVNEQTMTISPLYWCIALNADYFELLMVNSWL